MRASAMRKRRTANTFITKVRQPWGPLLPQDGQFSRLLGKMFLQHLQRTAVKDIRLDLQRLLASTQQASRSGPGVAEGVSCPGAAQPASPQWRDRD